MVLHGDDLVELVSAGIGHFLQHIRIEGLVGGVPGGINRVEIGELRLVVRCEEL